MASPHSTDASHMHAALAQADRFNRNDRQTQQARAVFREAAPWRKQKSSLPHTLLIYLEQRKLFPAWKCGTKPQNPESDTIVPGQVLYEATADTGIPSSDTPSGDDTTTTITTIPNTVVFL